MPPSLTVAFLRGDPRNLHDAFVMDGTWGPYVHTEVLLTPQAGPTRAYSSYDTAGGVVPVVPHAYGPEWDMVAFPLAPAGFYGLYAMLLAMIAAHPPYNRDDLWQCCVPFFLPFEADLDCAAPRTWTGGVFCSQFACLLLRWACRAGHVLPRGECRRRLEAVNSRGCSPNGLFSILTAREAPV